MVATRPIATTILTFLDLQERFGLNPTFCDRLQLIKLLIRDNPEYDLSAVFSAFLPRRS
ncbi:MAG: hypothetical protein HC890_10155 [Chloroflexaceae bacterium]|nr:hypothetical protein [Chloroflexaceae bacterium]